MATSTPSAPPAAPPADLPSTPLPSVPVGADTLEVVTSFWSSPLGLMAAGGIRLILIAVIIAVIAKTIAALISGASTLAATLTQVVSGIVAVGLLAVVATDPARAVMTVASASSTIISAVVTTLVQIVG